MKAYIIGRHAGTIPGVEVVGSENLNLPSTGTEDVINVISAVNERASAIGAECLIFQATPAVLTEAVLDNSAFVSETLSAFAVVSRPGARPAAVVTTIKVPRDWPDGPGDTGAEVVKAVKAANPNAKVTVDDDFGIQTITITVDPPMAFEFERLAKLW